MYFTLNKSLVIYRPQ